MLVTNVVNIQVLMGSRGGLERIWRGSKGSRTCFTASAGESDGSGRAAKSAKKRFARAAPVICGARANRVRGGGIFSERELDRARGMCNGSRTLLGEKEGVVW
eukprot:109529-Prorocentrum_minimum.AAC.1